MRVFIHICMQCMHYLNVYTIIIKLLSVIICYSHWLQNDELTEAVERMENFGCVAAEDLSIEQLRQEIVDLQLDVSEARDHLGTLVQTKTQLEYATICALMCIRYSGP